MRSARFRELIYSYYRADKRDLPWRRTCDPYAILVSEIMLQQTQVDRVVAKFNEWMRRYPTIALLAQASLGDVLTSWSGLGYNRRAKFLWQAAQKIIADFDGCVPTTLEGLKMLPGVGQYTAAAVFVFAYDKPAVVVETNIRAVYIHCFFANRERVSDAELIPFIEKTMDREHPREWFNALMDYGSKLKSEQANPARKSKHYAKQGRFEGSNRQVRGAILKALSSGTPLASLSFPTERVQFALADLIREGMVVERNGDFLLPE